MHMHIAREIRVIELLAAVGNACGGEESRLVESGEVAWHRRVITKPVF
jgi:hypothetical protein